MFYKKILKYSIIGLAVGFLNGVFGSGGGTVLVPILKYVLKIEDKTAHSTAILIILPLSIISSIFYIKSGFISYNILFFVSLGGVVGGFFGARLLKKINVKHLKRIFGGILIITAIKAVL